MHEMVIYGVSFDLVGKQPIVLLKTADGNKFLPIWITVTELKENTFYASITVQQNGSELEIDSRPSDAIALAVRAEAPIYAADDVIEESAIEFEGEDVNEEEIVSEFKQFLDNVTPDEFAEAESEED
jgi:bifunctional DNase/RNase